MFLMPRLCSCTIFVFVLCVFVNADHLTNVVSDAMTPVAFSVLTREKVVPGSVPDVRSGVKQIIPPRKADNRVIEDTANINITPAEETTIAPDEVPNVSEKSLSGEATNFPEKDPNVSEKSHSGEANNVPEKDPNVSEKSLSHSPQSPTQITNGIMAASKSMDSLHSIQKIVSIDNDSIPEALEAHVETDVNARPGPQHVPGADLPAIGQLGIVNADTELTNVPNVETNLHAVSQEVSLAAPEPVVATDQQNTVPPPPTTTNVVNGVVGKTTTDKLTSQVPFTPIHTTGAVIPNSNQQTNISPQQSESIPSALPEKQNSVVLNSNAVSLGMSAKKSHASKGANVALITDTEPSITAAVAGKGVIENDAEKLIAARINLIDSSAGNPQSTGNVVSQRGVTQANMIDETHSTATVVGSTPTWTTEAERQAESNKTPQNVVNVHKTVDEVTKQPTEPLAIIPETEIPAPPTVQAQIQDTGSSNVSSGGTEAGEQPVEVASGSLQGAGLTQAEDVDPLDIFVGDIVYQRFPSAMSLGEFKEKVLGRPLKKLYILEETDKRLFQNVRQLEVTYTLEGDQLYADFLYRFIFSRQCQSIQRFRIGNRVGNTDLAMFEKETGVEGVTERIVLFSERPDDYVFFMSCTDRKESPYACREKYYVSLETSHDPPNQFPWLEAAAELHNKLGLRFEDPRFIFNFVMLPCKRSE